MEILLHPLAHSELARVPMGERRAIANAIDKLRRPVHSWPTRTRARCRGQRELRPRAGRSPWRAFYQRAGALLVVAAIGPEAQVDPRGFRRAVEDALARMTEFGDSEGEMAAKSKLIPWEDVLAEQLCDPEFRTEWERTALAR